MFFPPVACALAVNALNIGKSYDVIIAVDGQRTHNVPELLTALKDATAGEPIYLVVIRNGRRNYKVLTLQ
jgi:S1-C subfamily serine protease